MFAQGATPGKVDAWCYNNENLDYTKGNPEKYSDVLTLLFTCTDAKTLDIWVLNRLKELFQNATSDANLDTQLRSDKVIFFLHLVGLDNTGHSYRPHSRVREKITPGFISIIFGRNT